MAYDIQKLVGIENPVASHFRPVNIARVAEGYDAVGLRITRPGELAELLPKAIASGRPTVFDCVIAREAIPPLAPYLEGQTAFFKRADML
jgi:thiamine pyrophosphate-dependent acetolactate synthase large subunit-like protein